MPWYTFVDKALNVRLLGKGFMCLLAWCSAIWMAGLVDTPAGSSGTASVMCLWALKEQKLDFVSDRWQQVSPSSLCFLCVSGFCLFFEDLFIYFSGEGERETLWQRPRQARSLKWRWIPRPWDHHLSRNHKLDAQLTDPSRRPVFVCLSVFAYFSVGSLFVNVGAIYRKLPLSHLYCKIFSLFDNIF